MSLAVFFAEYRMLPYSRLYFFIHVGIGKPKHQPLTNELINEYNTKLLNMANTVGVNCIDTNTALKSVEGTLSAEYWSADTGTFTDEAYKTIAGYILTHTV